MKTPTSRIAAETFLKMMEEDHIYLCRRLDFKSICLLLKESPEAVNEQLTELIGHTGEELISLMNDSYINYIAKKYNLSLDIAQ